MILQTSSIIDWVSLKHVSATFSFPVPTKHKKYLQWKGSAASELKLEKQRTITTI